MNAQQIADRLKATPNGDGSWMARCPAHDDHTPSLSIKSAGEKVLLNCFAGCTPEAVCGSMGIKVADLFAAPAKLTIPKRGLPGSIVAKYDYTDENGTLLYQVVRFDPKDFRQRKPSAGDGWDWNTKGIRRVLYRLPEVLAAMSRGETIFVCEGEKDCLALATLGLPATCNAGGAESNPRGSKWISAYTKCLSGATVVILPDRDKPGRRHAQIVAEHLRSGASSVRIVELPDHQGKPVKDAADFVDAGGGAEDIQRLVEAASPLDRAVTRLADQDEASEAPTPTIAETRSADPLVELYGSPYYLDDYGEINGLNERYWAGDFAAVNKVLYDPDEKSFYLYHAPRGLWQVVSADAIREMVSSRLLARSRSDGQPGLERQITQVRLKAICGALAGIVEKKGVFQEKRRIIHVQNGVVRFTREGDPRFGVFSPDDYSRNQSPHPFEAEAKCPRFLNELIHHAVTEEDASLIQRWLGLALFGYNLPQRFLILDGTPGGGKSTLVKIIQAMVGIENTYQLRTEHLNDRFEMYRFRGKTMLIAPDVAGDFLEQKGASRLKVIVGGDPLSVEAKGSNGDFSMFGTFNVIITCNSRLRLRLEGDVGAWRRRMLIVRYENPPPEKRILDFDKVLLREEGAGILLWAMVGFAKLQEEFQQTRDFELTDAQRGRIESLLAESDSLSIFIRECLVKTQGGTITSSQLVQRYSEFCADKGWNAMPSGVVESKSTDLMLQTWQVAKSHSIEGDGRRSNRGWRGVAFKEEWDNT